MLISKKSFQSIVLMAGVVLVGSNAFVLSPILAEVAEVLQTTPVRIAWAISSFGAATAVSALFLSPLTDVYGARITLTAAAALLSAAQVLCMSSGHWFWLCAGQALAGTSVGILLPGIYTTAMATADPGREAARLGFVLTGWALSLVLAVPLSATVAEYVGWRPVYGGLAVLSSLIGICFWFSIPPGSARSARRTSPQRALRLPGIPFLLLVSLGYMTAFYGCYAYFGDGIRRSLDLGPGGAGLYVLAYGAGFGLAGVCIGKIAPRLGRRYLASVLAAISATYLSWRFAIDYAAAAFLASFVWGFLNQFGLNALLVLLNRRAADARGAVMGLNSAVTYGAVFAGPFFLGPVYQWGDYAAVSTVAGLLVAAGCLAVLTRGAGLFSD
jgi:MFS transporter, DHA1 family, inner membrane transport protein